MQFIHLCSLQDYQTSWQQMQNFVNQRQENTGDEIWFCEHHPVFTLGQAGKTEHILNAHDIPIVQSDRGGQVTYHGPGFLMVYVLLDLNRLKLNTRELVRRLEQVIINLLKSYDIEAYADCSAPGVYVNGEKIASLGLRIRKGYTYHGICLNVNGDLTPFSYINPCGITGQVMTSLAKLGCNVELETVKQQLTTLFTSNFTF
jgi:lipoyl(octanoyl) transferase